MPFVIPLPEYLKKYEGQISNFGLRFQKFFPYANDELRTTCTVNKNAIESIRRLWQCYSDLKTSGIAGLLKKKNAVQDRFLEQRIGLSVDILKIRARLSSRLITGIGEPTPAEVGMVFDRNLGTPYIPGASIKGAVSYAYCVNYVSAAGPADDFVFEENGKTEFVTDEPGFNLLFGAREANHDRRGGFVFMDAYPESRPNIVMDIMNPHFGNYYKGLKPPSETDSPVPIKFLAVEKGLTFHFRGCFIDKKAEQYKPALVNAFKTALEMLGLGAKTSSGYGLFDNVTDESGTFKAAIETRKERERAKQEKIEKQKQEARIKEEKRLQEEQDRILREKADKAYQKAVNESEGIKKDILILERGDIQVAYRFYEQYLKDKKSLDDPDEIKLARLIAECFKSIPPVKGKKAAKNKKGAQKYEKRCHVKKLLNSMA